MPSTIRNLLDTNEQIIWEGKPDKVTYVIGSPVFYVFAFIWGAFDFGFISTFLSAGSGSGFGKMGFFLVPFFLMHLMPVWIAIGGPIYRAINWNYINYVITQKRVYVESGIIGRDVNLIEIADIQQPEVNVGVIEKLRNCGSIRLSPVARIDSDGGRRIFYRSTLAHIANPYDVFKMIKQMALDIKSDISYPNAMRPEVNPGYDTKYQPK
jgi:membrane protein YdbS with pleckstrin-like domain